MRVLSSLISLPFIAATLASGGCDPGTTRPDVIPFPESRTIEVTQDRPHALEALHRALLADSFPIAHLSARDLWLDTPWFDALSLAPAGTQRLGASVVKLRGWAEPARPGNSLLVVELVYRPLVDPSLPARTLERPVPPSDSIYARVGRVLKVLQDSIGAHSGGGARH